MGKLMVICLGGNAILQANQKGTAAEQYANIQRACRHLVPLLREGHRLVLTHGNGPQVGNLLIQQEESAKYVPSQPMDICVAMTQGQIGGMLQRVLTGQLRAAGLQTDVVTLISHFLVDPDDPDFQILSKPVGPFLTDALKERYEQQYGHVVRKIGSDPQRPYRRVVPSPMPLRLLEKSALRSLLDAGAVVVTAGGGGIPVVDDGHGGFKSIEAVIDKDLAGEKLAETVLADIFMILTDVPSVMLDYGTEKQRPIERMTIAEARAYSQAGQFGAGSMAPKVAACIHFVEFGGEAAIITSLASAAQALRGKAGTQIIRS